MKTPWLAGFAVLLLSMGGKPAYADDPYLTIRQFGLLGAWSTDCGDDTGATLITRFTMSSLGLPRLIVGQPDVILYSSVINAARLISPDQIALALQDVMGMPGQVLTLRLHDGVLQYATTAPGGSKTGDWSTPMRLCVSE